MATREGTENPPDGLVVLNLAGIIALGVGACAWVLYYTEWFPVIGGLLTLGGAFSWLAFVSKILHEDRVKSLQEKAEAYVLGQPLTLVGLIVLLVAGFVTTSFLGTVQVDSIPGSGPKVVQIGERQLKLSEGGRVRSVHWVSWRNPSDINVKVTGLPDKNVTVGPWCRKRLSSPRDFVRPIMVLRPQIGWGELIRSNSVHLVVRTSDGGYGEIAEYTGQAVWVNCDDNVEMPFRLTERWRMEAEMLERPMRLFDWLPPRALDGGPIELKVGEKITVGVKDDWSMPAVTFVDLDDTGSLNPQVVLIEEPEQ